ncbi:MAG: VWA domain-containing protein, partial [Chloroflexi bacterium]|nr:VWA domain-containing protein [Chloroflexota bacterium]
RQRYDEQLLQARQEPPFALKVRPSRTTLPCSHEPQMLYVYVGIEKAAGAPTGGSLNLCLVLDRSTSMQGARLQHAITAAAGVLSQLRPQDTVSVVAFGDRAEVLLPPQSGGVNSAALARLRSTVAGGGTEMAQGLAKGLSLVHSSARSDAAKQILLLTDGHTYGDEERCLQLANEARRSRVAVSAFGLGVDWNEALLDSLASRTGGRAFYIRSPERIAESFAIHLSQLASLVCSDLELACWLEPNDTLAEAFLVSPQLFRLPVRGGQPLPLGSVSTQAVTAVLLEICLASKVCGQQRIGTLQAKSNPASAGVGARPGAMAVQRVPLRAAFQQPPVPEQAAPDEVQEAAQRATLCKLEERVLKHLDRGAHREASRMLQSLSAQMADLGQGDLAQTSALEAQRVAQEGRMSPEGRKLLHYGTRTLLGPHGGK